MKIGVITWFNYDNYGTKLQALATQIFLKNIGYNVELVNFQLQDKPKSKRKISTIKFVHYIDRIILYTINFFNKKGIEEKKQINNKFIKNNCTISKKIESEEDYITVCNSYDCLVFGSDQIWNPNWFHKFYYGSYDEICVPKIAYAPSMGVSELTSEESEKLKNAVKDFKFISVREKNGQKIINDYVKKYCNLVCDPTMLITKSEWRKFEIKPKNMERNNNYILCYFLTDNVNHWIAAKKFAKKIKKKLLIIPQGGISYCMFEKVIYNCTVNNFLYLISHADYVITDSFHGTVFSILYSKQFSVFERTASSDKESQNARIYNLLDMINNKTPLINYNSKTITSICDIKYDYDIDVLNSFIENSKKYLIESLENVKNQIKS